MKKKDNLKILSSFIWKLAERVGSQVVTFIVSIIIARLINPEDYGLIVIVMIFISFADIFVTDGLTSSLVQKKNSEQVDFSTMFYINLIISFVLYILIYFTTPFIASFFENDSLILLIRIVALKVPLSSIGAIQQAFVSKNMMFKKLFLSTLIGNFISGLVGIIMAINGYGVWALAAQLLTNALINNLVLWFNVKWRPTLEFSFTRFKELFQYGWKILGANMIITFYNEVRSIAIGKLYSSADLAYYNKGKHFPSLIESNVNSTIASVLFPVLSKNQDCRGTLKELTRKSISIGSYIIWPLMTGLAVLAQPLVVIVLTEKWSHSVIYLQLYCIIYGLMPIQTANIQAIKATGNSGTYIKIEAIKRVVGLIVLFLVMRISVKAIVISTLGTALLFALINSFPNKYYIKYSYREQIIDVLPSFLLSISMGTIVYFVIMFFDNNFYKIIIGAFVGILTYFSLSLITKNKNFSYLMESIKQFFSINKN